MNNTGQIMQYIIRNIFFTLSMILPTLLYAQDKTVNGEDILTEPYGMCAHISRESLDYGNMKNIIDALNGIDWIRTDFDRYAIEENNGQYSSSILDSVVNYVASRGKKLLPIFDRKYKGYGWEDTLAYKNYVRFCVDHFKNKVSHWEVMNEPEWISTEKDLPDKYYKCLESVYNLIKQISPESTVMAGSLTLLSDIWLNKICEYQAYNYFDVVNVHSYLEPEINSVIFKRLNDNMTNNNWRRPIWMTEMGVHTAKDTLTNGSFFTEVLPQALAKVNISDTSAVAVICDYDYGYSALTDDEVDEYCAGYGSVSRVSFRELALLDPIKIPLLFASSQESFPYQYWNDIVNYVRRGGTIVLARGMPFYYNLQIDGTPQQVGVRFYKDLHISSMLWWSEDAKNKNVPEKPSWAREVGGFLLPKYKHIQPTLSARYLTTDNLKEGDEFISMLEAGNDGYRGSLVGIYKLNSDLKGNIVVSMRQDLPRYVNKEKEQARRVARMLLISFASGVDKVFWYNMRSFENNEYYSEDNYGLVHADFSPKPAYDAYKTIVKMLPSGATRPRMEVLNGTYKCSWKRPDGTSVIALWRPSDERYIQLDVDENSEVYNYMGDVIEYPKNGKYVVNGGVIYICSKNKTVR